MAKLNMVAALVIVVFAPLAHCGDTTIGEITKTPKPGNQTEIVVNGTITLGQNESWGGWTPYLLKPDGMTQIAVEIVTFTQPAAGETKNFQYKQTVSNNDNGTWSAVSKVDWINPPGSKTAAKGVTIP